MDIKKIAVLGAGQMGSGIAQLAALSGFDVVVRDINAEACAKGLAAITASLDRQVAKGRIDEEKKNAALSMLAFTDTLDDVADADFVIEAAPEILSLKQDTFTALGRICRADAVLCSNTSSMSITEITRGCVRPERCMGMHFFFPVQVMRLVEMIRSGKTSDTTVDTVRAVATAMGKVPVECRTDTPGFIVNRCLFAFMLEAIHEYEDGVATIEDIDTAMKLGLNHPMGPFEMMDMSGLDTFPHVTETLEKLPVTTWKCPESVGEKVASGKTGRKAGEGWYKY